MAEDANLEVWKVTIDVQKHFNDLGLRVRSIAVTVLGALLAAAGYALKERSAVDFFGHQVSLTGTILLAALVCWAAFYVMDRLWYHRLLKASVLHGRKIEEALVASIPIIGLTTSIDEASPLVGLRAGQRLSLFYGVIGACLWVGAGVALKATSPYYVVGIVVLLTAVTLELSTKQTPALDKGRGMMRLGATVSALYFGWWGLTWWFASSSIPKYLGWSREAADRGDWNTSTIWMRAANEANAAVMTSTLWGIVLPVAVLLLSGLLYWLYRGFQPRMKVTSTEGPADAHVG